MGVLCEPNTCYLRKKRERVHGSCSTEGGGGGMGSRTRLLEAAASMTVNHNCRAPYERQEEIRVDASALSSQPLHLPSHLPRKIATSLP